MKLKKTCAAAILACAPVMAQSATLNGQIGIFGVIDLTSSNIAPAGQATISSNSGFVLLTSGDFSSIAPFSTVVINDIDFSTPSTIWSVGGFQFTATSFGSFQINATSQSFIAEGVITGAGFDPTQAILGFAFSAFSGSSQASFSITSAASVVPLPAGWLLMGTALTGFCGLRRKKPQHQA